MVLCLTAFNHQKRHQSDAELNARKSQVLSDSGRFSDKKWRHIRVGDIVRLESDDFIPADLLLLSSSEPEGLCYIETSNLDGETNLKIKQASPKTSQMTSPQLVQRLQGYLRSEQPNNSLYTYEGTLVMTVDGTERQVPMSPDQILLRGAQLRNTPWVYGLVVFTGHETKLMRNATYARASTDNRPKLIKNLLQCHSNQTNGRRTTSQRTDCLPISPAYCSLPRVNDRIEHTLSKWKALS